MMDTKRIDELMSRGSAEELAAEIAPHITTANMTNAMLSAAWREQGLPHYAPLEYGAQNNARDTFYAMAVKVMQHPIYTVRDWLWSLIEKQPGLKALYAEWQKEANAELDALMTQMHQPLHDETIAMESERAAWLRRMFVLCSPGGSREVYDTEYAAYQARLDAIQAQYRPLYQTLKHKHDDRKSYWAMTLIDRMCDPVLGVALATLRRKNPYALLMLAELQGAV